MSRFQLYNGEFLTEDSAILQTSNRGYCYGDGFFESIKVANGEPLFIDEHWRRIQFTADFLKIQIPVAFTKQVFEGSIKQLCVQNKYANARVRFQAYRSGEGKYTPNSNFLSWSMTCQELTSAAFQLNKKGLLVGVCSTVRINPKPQSSFKTSNSIPYVLGGLYAQQMNWDDCMMLDSEGFIAESTNSNVFLIKDNTLFTPDLSNGGVKGVMRSRVIDVAEKTGFEVKTVLLTEADLNSADEFFLTNSVRGIQWVAAFGRKRYYKKKAELLLKHLNLIVGLRVD